MHKHIIILFLTCLFFTISYSNLWGAENTDTPKIFADQSGLFGATDASGKIIIPFKYQWVEQIEDLDNLYFVGVTSPTSRSSLGLDFGVMNDQGKLIVPIKYSVIIYDSFLKHRFKVFLDANVPSTKIGYLDENGKVIVPPIYDELRGISYKGSKPTYIGTLDGKYGYINVVTGKVMIPFEYEELKISSQETDEQGNGVVAARKKELYGLITTNNVEVCPFK